MCGLEMTTFKSRLTLTLRKYLDLVCSGTQSLSFDAAADKG